MSVDLAATGGRVRSARVRAGLSQRDVAAQTEISQPTLQRLETGQRTRVTLAEFDRLATALSVSLDELLYGSAVRKRVMAAARTSECVADDLEAALEQVIELLKLDDLLDAVVPNLRQEAEKPRLNAPTMGSPSERGRSAAELARTALGIHVAPIADLVEAAELLTGVDVGTTSLPSGVSGLCGIDSDRATAIVLVNSNDVIERQRFTLAHELGHLFLDDATHVDVIDATRTPQEVFCDEFARHFLMPRAGVEAWLTRTVGSSDRDHVDERALALIARHFGVSPKAAQIQLDRMGLLPDDLKTTDLPSGRRWAYRYGWGPQYDNDQAAAHQPRAPRRILERATQAYRAGKLGVNVLAKLQDRSVPQVEQALAEDDVVARPTVRRADVAGLVARASERKSSVGR